MKGKIALMALLLTIALVGAVSALPVTITDLEIDDNDVQPGDTVRLDVLRGDSFDIEIRAESPVDLDDVEWTAFITGYEYNRAQALFDAVGPFDMDANVSYKKTLKITLPDEVDEDDYKLRIVISDRNGDEVIQNFNVKIDVERHKLRLEDFIVQPSGSVKAGSAIIATARYENLGEKDEDDVKVTVSIPELGLSASEYINEIETEEEEESEEMFLRLPKCAEPGVYEVHIIAEYQDGHELLVNKAHINVDENPSCVKEPTVEVIVQEPQPKEGDVMAESVKDSGKVRTALEVILIALVALLVIVGLVIGFTKLGKNDLDY